MAVEWTGVKCTRGSEYLFDPADLLIRPELNGRAEAPDIEDLIADILVPGRGQLQPVLVRNDGGKPVLVAGFSRWRAISEINKRGLTPVPLKIRCTFFRGNEREGLLANIAENLQRNATTPLDDAHNCRMLEVWGMSVADIAGKLRQSEAWVRGRLKIAEATPEVQEALKDGRIKASAAATIAKLSESQQRKAVAGEGSVKAPTNGRPPIKDLRARIIETMDDTTQDKQVREFCRALVQQWWPTALKTEEEINA